MPARHLVILYIKCLIKKKKTIWENMAGCHICFVVPPLWQNEAQIVKDKKNNNIKLRFANTPKANHKVIAKLAGLII